MTVKIQQLVINTLNYDTREIEKTSIAESYLIYPDDGKALKNTVTGDIIDSFVCVNTKKKINNYVEIDA